MRLRFGPAGPSRYCGPRPLSAVVVRPLNFTVRPPARALVASLDVIRQRRILTRCSASLRRGSLPSSFSIT